MSKPDESCAECYRAGYAQAEKDIIDGLISGVIVSNMQPQTGDDCKHGVISYYDCTECIAEAIKHGEHRKQDT